MPYTYKKVGDKYQVFKTGKLIGMTTKDNLKRYLAALHLHSKDSKK
jgi:hypothetical protein